MISGSCLCGAIRYETQATVGPLGHCHCQWCRKAHGSAFSSILPVARSGFRWVSGEDRLSSYESSPGKHRWFCSHCGSQLIATRDENRDSLLLRAGCIDAGWAKPGVAHGWVGFKASWYAIADELPQFDREFPGSAKGVD